MSRTGLWAVALAAMALAACASDSEPDRACPKVSFVGGLDRMVAFDGAAEPANGLWEARLSRLTAGCKFESRGAAVPLEFLVVADRGPANRDGLARPEFFVAVTGPADEVLVKETFVAELPFSDNRSRIARKESIEPFLPYPGAGDLAGYRVLIGFQMTPEQRDFIKRFRE